MAIKVKRKAATPTEVVPDDQIYSFNEGVFNYVEANKVPFAIGLGALLLTIVVVVSLGGASKNRTVESGAALLSAVQVSQRPVGADDPTIIDPEAPRFDTEEQLVAATRAALGDLAGDDAAPAAALLAGSIAATADEIDQARQRFAAVATDDETPASMRTVAALSSASLEVSAGDLAAARSRLETISASMPALAPVVQLELARQTEAAGDLAEAQRLYAALAEVEPPAQPSMTELEIARTARFRANLLSVALGQPAPAASDDGAAGDGAEE
jgi:hypothetical protein